LGECAEEIVPVRLGTSSAIKKREGDRIAEECVCRKRKKWIFGQRKGKGKERQSNGELRKVKQVATTV
jgi:hypothetical protein